MGLLLAANSRSGMSQHSPEICILFGCVLFPGSRLLLGITAHDPVDWHCMDMFH
jgi:hypothetical protein